MRDHVISGYNVTVLWKRLSKHEDAERRGRLSLSLPLLSGVLVSLRACSQEVRGHCSVSVVQMSAFPGANGASSGHSKGICFQGRLKRK